MLRKLERAELRVLRIDLTEELRHGTTFPITSPAYAAGLTMLGYLVVADRDAVVYENNHTLTFEYETGIDLAPVPVSLVRKEEDE